MAGSVVVLLGFDGSGKSTVLGRLAKAGFSTSTWKNLRTLNALRHRREVLKAPGQFRGHLTPMMRAIFQAQVLYEEYELLIQPKRRKGETVVVESYYLRPLAKELIKARSEWRILQQVAHVLPKPDYVVVLDLPPKVAFRRLQSSPAEHEYLRRPTLRDFCKYQRAVLAAALGFAEDAALFRVDANREPDLVFNDIAAIIAGLPRAIAYGKTS